MEAIVLNVDLGLSVEPNSKKEAAMDFFDLPWIEPTFVKPASNVEKVEERIESIILEEEVDVDDEKMASENDSHQEPSIPMGFGTLVQWLHQHCSHVALYAGKSLFKPITLDRMNHRIPGFEESIRSFDHVEINDVQRGIIPKLLLSVFAKEEYKVYEGIEIVDYIPHGTYDPQTRLTDLIHFLEGFRRFHLTAKNYILIQEIVDGQIIMDECRYGRLSFRKALVMTVNPQLEVERRFLDRNPQGCRLVDLYGRRKGYFVVGTSKPQSLSSIIQRETDRAASFTEVQQWHDYIQSVKERYPQRYFFKGEFKEGVGAQILRGVLATFASWKEEMGIVDEQKTPAGPSTEKKGIGTMKEKPVEKPKEAPPVGPKGESKLKPLPTPKMSSTEDEEPMRRPSAPVSMDLDMFF